MGRRGDLGTCLPGTDAVGCEIAWVERPVGGDAPRLRAAVELLRPDVVLVLEPEPGEGAALAGLGAVTGAWLVAALETGSEAERGATDGFDRVLAACPVAARRAGKRAIWRVEPLPVSDVLFAPVDGLGVPPRMFFDGPASERRDTILQPVKHAFDVLHLAGGADLRRLAELLARCDVAIDLREEAGIGPRDRIGPALAGGLLVLAEEPLERPGLSAGTHLVTFGEVWELHDLLAEVRRHPDALRSVRVRGRRAAEILRGSVALPRLVEELLADAALFGRR